MQLTLHAQQRWKERGFQGAWYYCLKRAVSVGKVHGRELRYYEPQQCIFVCKDNKVLTVIRFDEFTNRAHAEPVLAYLASRSKLSQCPDNLRI